MYLIIFILIYLLWVSEAFRLIMTTIAVIAFPVVFIASLYTNFLVVLGVCAAYTALFIYIGKKDRQLCLEEEII